MSTRATALGLALVCAAALVLRLAYVAVLEVDRPIRADAHQYVRYAFNLVEHRTFSRELGDAASPPRPDSFRSPGYPALLALVLLAAGPDGFYAATLRLQALLGAALVPLTWLLGRQLLPPAAALGAAALVALSPHLVSMTGYVLTETLSGLLLLAALAAFARALRRQEASAFAAAGLLAGCGALTNQTAALLPLAWAAVALRGSASAARRRLVRGLAAFLVASALLPSLWALRDALSLSEGARRPAHRALATLTHGSYPGWVHRDPRYRYYAYREDPEAPRMMASLAGFAEVMGARVRERPLRYLSWYLIEKPAVLWTWDSLQGQGDVYVYPVLRSLYGSSAVAAATRAAMRALHPLVLLAALVGIPLCLGSPRRGGVLPALLLITGLYFSALYALFAPWPRYSIPLRPELYLWAVWAAVEGSRRLRERAGPRARPAP